jgi:hypothetical protein
MENPPIRPCAGDIGSKPSTVRRSSWIECRRLSSIVSFVSVNPFYHIFALLNRLFRLDEAAVTFDSLGKSALKPAGLFFASRQTIDFEHIT